MKLKKQVREHNPIDWKAVFRMAVAKKRGGKPRYSITDMAQKLGYYNKQSSDPTQEFRGMLSRARTIGVRIGGKLVKLPKATVRRGGKPVMTKAPKAKVTAAPKVKAAVKAPKVKAVKAPKVTVQKAKKVAKVAGKNVVAVQMHESGRVVKVQVGGTEALVPKKEMVPQLDNLAHEMGYKLVKADEPAKAPAEAPAQTSQAAEATQPEPPQVAPETPATENPEANHSAA